jgi:hypothetical protein
MNSGACSTTMLMFGSMYAQIDSRADYNDYCHYTGGLVGLGRTRLFYTAGVEQFTPDYLSNAMGLLLRVRCFSSFPCSLHHLMHYLYPHQYAGLSLSCNHAFCCLCSEN